MPGRHFISYQTVYSMQQRFYPESEPFALFCQVNLFVTPVRRVSSTFYPAFLFQIIDKIGKASYCWLTPGFFHKRCITWSISNVMSTLLVLNTLCMVWRKVIRVFRIWSISSCAVSLFAIAVYFYGTKIVNILEISVKCLIVD